MYMCTVQFSALTVDQLFVSRCTQHLVKSQISCTNDGRPVPVQCILPTNVVTFTSTAQPTRVQRLPVHCLKNSEDVDGLLPC